MIVQGKHDFSRSTQRLADGGARLFKKPLAQVLAGESIGHAYHKCVLGKIKGGCATEPRCEGASRDPLSNALERGLPDLSRIGGRATARLIPPHSCRSHDEQPGQRCTLQRITLS